MEPRSPSIATCSSCVRYSRTPANQRAAIITEEFSDLDLTGSSTSSLATTVDVASCRTLSLVGRFLTISLVDQPRMTRTSPELFFDSMTTVRHRRIIPSSMFQMELTRPQSIQRGSSPTEYEIVLEWISIP